MSSAGAPGTPAYGADQAFKTPAAPSPFGRAKLTSSKLKVKGGKASMTFTCTGAAGAKCKGKATLTARSKGKTLSCGKGSFSGTAQHRTTVKTKPSGACRSLVAAAHKHSLAATLKVVFSTHQATLTRRVTLQG